jgi:hypothetical protein
MPVRMYPPEDCVIRARRQPPAQEFFCRDYNPTNLPDFFIRYNPP